MYSSAYRRMLMMRRPRRPKACSPMSGNVRIQDASAMHLPSNLPVYKNRNPAQTQHQTKGRYTRQ